MLVVVQDLAVLHHKVLYTRVRREAARRPRQARLEWGPCLRGSYKISLLGRLTVRRLLVMKRPRQPLQISPLRYNNNTGVNVQSLRVE